MSSETEDVRGRRRSRGRLVRRIGCGTRVYPDGVIHHFGLGTLRGEAGNPGERNSDAIRAVEDRDRSYRDLMANREAI